MEDTPRRNFQIPRKSKEKRALFQYVSPGSREYNDISKIVTSGYKDPSSWGSYQYTKHCLVHSEIQEKDFIEKRRELKMEGRSEKEMVESYCFLLCESYKLQSISDKGLHVGHSWMNLLGNPAKGVYLSKYSDLLQINPFEPGITGDIVVFKVIKGKMKGITDNMSRSLDPTPKFDSHISKSFSRVASHRSYRAFEYTQQYFYEYDDIDVRTRPRHICAYAVVSFSFKGKDSAPLAKPMPPVRSNSFPSGKVEKRSYDVWSGPLTNGGKEVYHVSFRSLSQPILPFKLPDKIEIGTVMHLDQVKLKIPPTLFSWDLYSGSQEVCKKGTHCCLFEVVDKNKYGNNFTVLLNKLEQEKLVLVNTVTDRGFFFLLSSTQLANPSERREGWKGSNLQALFVFPESRDVTKTSLKPTSTPSHLQSTPTSSRSQLTQFVPALHFALNKVRCTPQSSPPANPSVAVEQQLHDYLSGQRDGKLLPRVHTDYDHKLDDRERLFPAPRNRLNLEAYLKSYVCCANLYHFPVAKAQAMMMDYRPKAQEGRAESTSAGASGAEDPDKVAMLLALIQKEKAAKVSETSAAAMTLKRKREEELAIARGKCAKMSTLNQEDAAEDDCLSTSSPLADVLELVGGLRDTDLRKNKTEDDGLQAASSLADVMSLAGLCDTDLRKNKTEGAVKLMEMLDTIQTATVDSPSPSFDEGMETEVMEEDNEQPEETLEDSRIKLGLPINCDIDLRKRSMDKEDFAECEVASVESMSSLEAFSPCSDHGLQRGTNLLGEKSIPWVLIPITGIKPGRYTQRQWDNPQDPRLMYSTTDSLQPQQKAEPATKPDLDTSYEEPSQPEAEESHKESGEEAAEEVEESDTEKDVHSEEKFCQEDKNSTEESKEENVIDESKEENLTEESKEENLTEESKENNSTEESKENNLMDESKEKNSTEESTEQNSTDESKENNSLDESYLLSSSSSPPPPSFSPCQVDPVQSQSVVDSIVDEQLTDFSAGVMSLLKRKQMPYQAPPRCSSGPLSQPRTHVRPFSDYISQHHEPVPLYGFVRTLRSSLTSYIDSHLRVAVPESERSVTAQSSAVDALSPPHASLSTVSTPAFSSSMARPDVDPQPDLRTLLPPRGASNDPSSSQTSTAHLQSLPHPFSNEEETSPQPSQDDCLTLSEWRLDEHTEQEAAEVDSGFCTRASTHLPTEDTKNLRMESSPPPASAPAAADDEAIGATSLTNLINQLNPEMFSSLVEIIKGVRKNAVHFYIHSGDSGEDQVCSDIKEYLLRQGNAECNPQRFLESRSDKDKLQVIIRNEDIASEIHKIPELVKLKKLPFVSFAGVDSIEDVRNNTYNELFVSGGFVVSDEFVLNPDFTTWERLHRLLECLERMNTPETPWRWKIHCRTVKRLREQSRVNGDAYDLLNVLTAYQKRHVVEFMPYHECDTPGNSVNILACLVKLQSQHTQHRHVIFLTECHFEKFQHYGSSGIMVATIDDVISKLNTLSGLHDGQPKPPLFQNDPATPLALPEHKKEDSAMTSEQSLTRLNMAAACGKADERQCAPPPPPPDSSQTPPDQLVPDSGNSLLSQPSPITTAASQDSELDALRVALSQIKAATTTANTDSTSQTDFKLITHQSFLGGGLPPAELCTTSSTLQQSVSSPTSSSSSSLLPLNSEQRTSESEVERLKLLGTRPRLSQDDLTSSQQVQETTVTTSSQDCSAPASPPGDLTAAVSRRDFSLGPESLVASHASCDDTVSTFGNADQSATTNTVSISQTDTVCGVAQDSTTSVPSAGTGDATFQETIKSEGGRGLNHHHRNGPLLPTPPSVTAAKNALTSKPEGKSEPVPTSTSNNVPSITSKQELGESPSLNNKQPEQSVSAHGSNNTLAVHSDVALPQHPSTSVATKEDSGAQQVASMWPYPQVPAVAMGGLRPGINTATPRGPMAAMMFQHMMGGSFGNPMGGLMPRPDMLPMPGVPMGPMAWGGYPRGGGPAAAGMWGMQQGLPFGPMYHQTQFIQGFTWRSGYSGQGNGYRP